LIKKKDTPKGASALGYVSERPIDPFVLTARKSAEDSYNYARQEGIVNAEVIFEKGDPENCLRFHFRESGIPEPLFAWNRPRTSRKGLRERHFIGLQAAGWIAWEYYLDACRTSGVVDQMPSQTGRFPFREFEKMPGDVIMPFMSSPGRDIIDQIIGRGVIDWSMMDKQENPPS
jgi:hypothetical protein